MNSIKIAVIQLSFPLQGYTRDLVNALTEKGCIVDLIINSDCDKNFIDLSSITCNVCEINKNKIVGYLERIRGRIAQYTNALPYINSFITRRDVCSVIDKLNKHDVLIGIEKNGLEMAYLWSKKNHNIPVVYWSLELYIEDHFAYKNFRWQRKSEKFCHQNAEGTIIQDKYRWLALKTANDVRNDNVFYLPIVVRKNMATNVIDKSNTCITNPIKLLYFGIIDKNRMSFDIVRQIQRFKELNVKLRLHGPVVNKTNNKIFDENIPPTIKITTNLVSEKEVYDIINENDIGIALYKSDNSNDYYTIYSSQKIALYLQCGKPIIVWQTEPAKDLFNRYKCGVMINNLEELEEAVQKIQQYYDNYQKEALRAFSDIYDSDIYWDNLINFLIQRLNKIGIT